MFGDPRLPPRFWSKVAIQPNGCWYWAAALNKGYGVYYAGKDEQGRKKNSEAHRHIYCTLIAQPPPGYEVDHVCHTQDTSCLGGDSCLHKRCCNPEHLEAVLKIVNCERAKPSRDTCSRGHAWTPETTYVWRGLRACSLCRQISESKRPSRNKTTPSRSKQLAPEQVREIRRLSDACELAVREIAIRFDVGESSVRAIAKRKIWRNIV